MHGSKQGLLVPNDGNNKYEEVQRERQLRRGLRKLVNVSMRLLPALVPGWAVTSLARLQRHTTRHVHVQSPLLGFPAAVMGNDTLRRVTPAKKASQPSKTASILLYRV